MKPIELLLVEDNLADADLTRESLEHGRLQLTLSLVMDGVEALDFLHRRGRYGHAPRPNIMLLDLNLPRMDGRQLLAEIKSDPDLRLIPIVVLTSSEAEADIIRSYDLGASCYVAKPVDLHGFKNIVKALEQFWFTVVSLPPADPSRTIEAI